MNPSIYQAFSNTVARPKDFHQLHPERQLQLPLRKGYALFCWEGNVWHNQIKNPHSFFEGLKEDTPYSEKKRSLCRTVGTIMFLSTTFLCRAAIEEGDYAVFSVAFLLTSVSKEPLTTFNQRSLKGSVSQASYTLGKIKIVYCQYEIHLQMVGFPLLFWTTKVKVI